MTKRNLNRYVGLDNRDLKARSMLTPAERARQKYAAFIVAVNQAKSMDEACEATGLKRREIISLSSSLRHQFKIPIQTFRIFLEQKEKAIIRELQALGRKTLPPPLLDLKRFVVLWNTKGIKAVMKELNLTNAQAHWTAHNLRRTAGVPLKFHQQKRGTYKSLIPLAKKTLLKP